MKASEEKKEKKKITIFTLLLKLTKATFVNSLRSYFPCFRPFTRLEFI